MPNSLTVSLAKAKEQRRTLRSIARNSLRLSLQEVTQQWDDHWLIAAENVARDEQERPKAWYEKLGWMRSRTWWWDCYLVKTTHDVVKALRKTPLYLKKNNLL